ncbi:hypothetical protein PHYBOEH_002112 [Phytophthora boehmeriae]|uniref:Alpha/beta hydrolase fold-3 domain-containing protein n=1 Tax=Phytophthora boehmeriae TaxID=109152 RepID=A0A8T1XAH3_9STRA|nr:hypothetical protein PHYBOEH_002112 [Phytophthora boehmeriae]
MTSPAFRDSLRSQSSVQLMGFIDHCVHVDVDETTEEGELRIRGYETLLGTSTAVLSCIQVLRRIIREYAYGRVGRELQHLSLTVASFERILYTFIKEEIVVASKHYASGPPVDFRTKTALKDIIPLIPTDERYTILSGGIASLLRHATKSLDETRQVLEELQSGYNPDRENRWSRTSVVLALTFFFLYKQFRLRKSFKQFLMQVVPSSQMVKWGLALLVGIDYWNRAMYRFSNLRRIKDFYNLTNWACVLGAVIVYVDYGLAPETQYPNSLNQCLTVYKWVLTGGLGFRPGKVTLFGESAGANIGAALCVRCIQEGIELPSGNTFMFPALNLHLSPSPSRFLHQSDPVLPRGILELALTSYYPSHGHSNQYKFNIHDPCVSPGLAEDALLEKFPPTSLVVGDLDPLLDDSVDFYTRLSFLKVPSTLKIYSGLSHGFLIYGDLVPEAQKAIDETCERVQSYIRLR